MSRPTAEPLEAIPGPHADDRIAVERAVDLLLTGRMSIEGQLISGSNRTFLARIDDGETAALAVYKPQRGERPLWDFPTGTLAGREVAAYLMSEALGWGLVPPTVQREGDLGIGMAQWFIPHDPEMHYLVLSDLADEVVHRLAAFDRVINNADRKSGHVLLGGDGSIWAIDHGISFHVEPKLRTVIWEVAGEALPESVYRDLSSARRMLDAPDGLRERLRSLLTEEEIDALARRMDVLIAARRHPDPGEPGRHIPWPPV